KDQSIPSRTPLTPPPQQPQDIPSTSQVAQDLDIIKLKTRVKKLERAKKVKALKLRRLRKVGPFQRVDTLDDTIMEDVSTQGRMIDVLDKDEGVVLMSEKDEEKEAEEVKDTTGDAQAEGRQAEIYQIDMDHATKVISMQDDELEVQEAVVVVTIAKLITEVVAVVIKVAAASTRRRRGVVIKDPEEESTAEIPNETKSKDKGKGIMEQIEEEANKALESINETPAQKATKRRRMNEEVKDVEEIKQHLEIVPDEDDDIYTEATPLARKVTVMDYQIVHFNNKPHYKIIHADGTHQLYVNFITLLKNFDREDLESLWSLVKDKFSTSKPNNFSNDYLLITFRAMFERPDGQYQVWKSQRSVHSQARVKSWKLLESCGVHIITFTTTQMILLV
nr:hypothetical protein [Tanacetum cinerariifolium]